MGDDVLDGPPDLFAWIVKGRESCSGANQIATLTRTFDGAEDGIRTRDPHLGKVMRYHCATSALDSHITPSAVPG